MRRCGTLVAIACLWPVQAWAATPAQVDAAIQRGVDYLYKLQKNNNWERVPQRDPAKAHHEVDGWQWGGLSAIATCALLYANENPQDPRLRNAIEWLAAQEIYGTYALGFRCQVWAMLPRTPAVQRAARRDADHLLNALIPPGPDARKAVGYFPYYYFQGKRGENDTNRDHSVSQYGVLGLWACSQAGIEIPTGAWQVIEKAWKDHQYETGGWSYRYKHENPDWARETLAMTAAGVASLFITQEYLHSMVGLTCQGTWSDPHLEYGLKWIGENFDSFKERRTYYTLYGIERIGVASGIKYFDKLNWYEEGAEYLVRGQNKDGSWGAADANENADKIPDTCFAIMFLARGRAPVMMNKLEYATQPPQAPAGASRRRVPPPHPSTWNQRPREVANITRWVGRQIERDLNWQIVNLKAPLEDLHDAPILWISGKDPLQFDEQEQAKLRSFVEQGGILFGHADCASRNFSESFRKLGLKLFPQYEFRELPEEHPIYTNQQFPRRAWKRPPSVLGLSNGVRELMLLVPRDDPGRGWQTQAFLGGEREPLAQLAANIFLYSVDRTNLRNKGETYIVKPDEKVKPAQTIRVARLEYAGNWNPEPAGWPRLSAILRNRFAVELAIEPVKLGSGKLTNDYTVAHLTGTTRLALTPPQQEELRRFVAGGGTLIVDAAGGAGDFALSAEPLLNEIFKPAGQLQLIKRDHPLFTTGETITEVDYRAFARKQLGMVRLPRLEGIEEKGRVRIFFSGEDLSAGLVGQPVDGIFGYTPESAAALMGNMVLYAYGKPVRRVTPTSGPAPKAPEKK